MSANNISLPHREIQGFQVGETQLFPNGNKIEKQNLNQEMFSNLLGKLIPHTMSTKYLRDQDTRTEELWKKMYQHGTPFYINVEKIPPELKPYRSELSSHFINAVKEYRDFIRQVSLPHYQDEKFLHYAVQTYIEGALSGDLRKTAYPYHNAFMWKTHQLHPSEYRRDLKHLKEQRASSVSSRKTARSLKSTKSGVSTSYLKRRGSMPLPPIYNDRNEMVNGAMYRGEPIQLHPRLPYEVVAAMGNKIHNLSVVAFKVEDLDPNHKYEFLINGKSPVREEFNFLSFDIVSKGSILVKTFNETSEFNTLSFDEDKFKEMQIVLVEYNNSRKYGVGSQNIYKTEFKFPTQKYAEGAQFKITFRLPLAERNVPRRREVNGWISFKAHRPTLGVLKFSFKKDVNHLSKTKHYCDVIKFPVTMVPYATKLHDAPANYLNMLINDSEGRAAFRCRILQADNGEFSSVEIFDMKGAMVSSSYTIGKESLPAPDQVAHPDTCCILRDINEMVFVIRGTNYEWGLLKVFQHFHSQDILPAGVLFMNLMSEKPLWERLYDHQNKVNIIYHKCRKGGLFVNLETATMSLPPLYREFPDLLALGTTILTLFCVKKFQRM